MQNSLPAGLDRATDCRFKEAGSPALVTLPQRDAGHHPTAANPKFPR
jgi:hypothetical protein